MKSSDFLAEIQSIFSGSNDTFPWTLIITDTWKNFGYSSIVYLAAMSSIDPALYEAAEMDGAGKIKKFSMSHCRHFAHDFCHERSYHWAMY